MDVAGLGVTMRSAGGVDVSALVLFGWTTAFERASEPEANFGNRYMSGEPVMFVRQEDLVVRPFEVASEICRAAFNIEINRSSFVPLEKNSKEAKEGKRTGHKPAVDENGKIATASKYAEQLKDINHVWSDQNHERFSPAALKHIHRHLNMTLMRFFGYFGEPPRPS